MNNVLYIDFESGHVEFVERYKKCYNRYLSLYKDPNDVSFYAMFPNELIIEEDLTEDVDYTLKKMAELARRVNTQFGNKEEFCIAYFTVKHYGVDYTFVLLGKSFKEILNYEW